MSASDIRARPGPRERLLSATERLTYSHGIDVGIDAILREADVARRSLYEHFGGKEGLITEVLRRSAVADLEHYRQAMTAAGDAPRDRILSIYDYLGGIVSQPDFRGCRYLAADLAIADRDHPAHAVAAAYRADLQTLLRAEAERLGATDPAAVAEELYLLVEGVLAFAAGTNTAHPAIVAHRSATRLLDELSGRGTND